MVYGDAQDHGKENFLPELSSVCHSFKFPALIGGDFNIIRRENEKNKPGGVNIWSFLFNAIIENYGLLELELKGRKYTWANNKENRTFEKLDRFLVTPEWDLQYQNAAVTGLNRSISDHVPLLLDTGGSQKGDQLFRFELCWLERPDFHEIVVKNWTLPAKGTSSIERWQHKMRRLRKGLKG